MFLIIILSVLLLDQLTKYLSFAFLQPEGTIPVINKYLYLTYVENRGTISYMLENRTVLLFVVITTLTVFIYVYKNRHISPIARYSIALMIGGAAGNIIDRIRHGFIIGFFDFYMWPIFNLADICIATGFMVIVFRNLMARQKVRS